MPVESQLQVGLKEWASVCNALADGKQIILLRKGLSRIQILQLMALKATQPGLKN